MKRRWTLVIALILSIAVCSSGLAAEKVINPFITVPAGHWTYDAINSLAKAQVIDANNGEYRNLTRYEMAELVARALTRQDKADAAGLATLEKLKQEFRLELTKMGAMVPAKQTTAKKSDNKTSWSAEVRTRYTNHTLDNLSPTRRVSQYLQPDNNNQTVMRTRLTLEGKINNDWNYFGRWENEQNLRDSIAQGTTNFNVAYVEGPVLGTKLAVGRIPYIPAYGLVMDSYFDGLQLKFGNKLKATVFYGKEDNQSTSVKQSDAGINKESPAGTVGNRFLVSNRLWGAPALSTTSSVAAVRQPGAVVDTHMAGFELAYDVSQDTSLKGAYLMLEAPDMIPEAKAVKARFMELGIESKLDSIWTLNGIYSRSNADNNNVGLMLGLKYKQYDLKKPKSFNFYLTYRNLDRFSTYYSTYDLTNITPYLTYNLRTSNNSPDYDAARISGSKGFEYGFNYVINKDMLLNCYLITAKPTAIPTDALQNGISFKQKMFRTDLYWYF